MISKIKIQKKFFTLTMAPLLFFCVGCGVYSSAKPKDPCLNHAPYPQIGILKKDYKKWQKQCYQRKKNIKIKKRSYFKLD